MTEKHHHNPPLLVAGHLTLMFLFNVEGDEYMSFLIQWHISDRRRFSCCRQAEEFEALTNSSLVCTLPSLLGRRTCSDHALCHFCCPFKGSFSLLIL